MKGIVPTFVLTTNSLVGQIMMGNRPPGFIAPDVHPSFNLAMHNWEQPSILAILIMISMKLAPAMVY
jgi:hypothetical protein